MTKTSSLPTLSDLQQSPTPAWLWDPDRLRIVWANKAAVEAFEAETLFDVLDLRFAEAEEGVEELTRQSATLDDTETRNIRLRLGSLSSGEAVQAKVSRHSLPDGRTGLAILVRGSDEADDREALRNTALDQLPQPVLIVSPDGTVVDRNQEARRLFEGRSVSVETLLGSAAARERFAKDIARSGIANRLVDAETRFGVRTLRLLGKRLDDAGIVVLIDDVTERRALERSLDAARSGFDAPAAAPKSPVKPLTAEDASTFEKLGEAVRSATPESAEPAAPVAPATPPVASEPEPAKVRPAPEAEPEPAVAQAPSTPALAAAPARREIPRESKPAELVPARGAVHVPEIIKRSLDLSPVPTVLLQENALLYANKAAVKLFDALDYRDLVGKSDLVELVTAVADGQSGTIMIAGRPVEVAVRLTSFPFTTGPATKAELLVELDQEARAPELPLPRPEKREREPAAVAANAPLPPEFTPPPEPKAKPRFDQGPSAEELISILDTATDGIATLDAQGNILSLSAGAEAIFGLRQAEVLGKPIADLMDGDGPKLVRDYLAALGESGIAAVFNDGLEVQAVTSSGGRSPIFLTIGVLGDKGARKETPERAAFCAVFRDITQWKQTEAELRAAKEEAERASAQKSDFLAKISHELRTPLNAILGFSEVMRTERFGEMPNQKYLGYANDIHSSGEHLLSLINDLLDLSKIETGKMELNFTAVNLVELTDHCLRLFEEDARARRIVVRKNFPANLPNVVADLRSMKQVLLNLVSNAIKFTQPGGQVILSGSYTPAGEYSLKVKDTGLGMAEEELAVALQPFGRIHADERPDIPGTGLGLPLTKALVEANRAKFTLTSSRGKGTLAEIVFPVNRVLGG